MLTTNQKGAIAETAIAHEAAKLGIGVFKPLADERYDFIFDLRPRLVRVQCKWAVRRGGALVIPFYSARRTRDGVVRNFYSPSEIDAFAAYCAELDRCYFIAGEDVIGRATLQLRIDPPANNQAVGVRWAKDYEFAATLPSQNAGP